MLAAYYLAYITGTALSAALMGLAWLPFALSLLSLVGAIVPTVCMADTRMRSNSLQDDEQVERQEEATTNGDRGTTDRPPSDPETLTKSSSSRWAKSVPSVGVTVAWV